MGEFASSLNPSLSRRGLLVAAGVALLLAGCGSESTETPTVSFTQITPEDFLDPTKQKMYYDTRTQLALAFHDRLIIPPAEGEIPEIDYTYPVLGPGAEQAKISGGYRYVLQNPAEPDKAKIILCITPPNTQAFILLTRYLQGHPIGTPYALEGSEVKVTKVVKAHDIATFNPPAPTFLCTQILAR